MKETAEINGNFLITFLFIHEFVTISEETFLRLFSKNDQLVEVQRGEEELKTG